MDNAIATTAPLNLIPTTFGGRIAALPARSKFIVAVAVAALLAVLATLVMNTRQGDYKVLFSNLSEKDGGPIIEKLAQMNVPYRFADGSGTLLVPAAQLYDLRFKLSAAGLPKGSVNGYELLDKTPFGQTQGQEQITRQRALEGELTRTIQSLASVESARVHLGLPHQNGFFREQQKPSASVVVSLHPGRTLEAAQIAGIVHLVSSSVPELMAKAVTVLDSSGALLSGQGETHAAQGLDAHQVQYLRDVESTHLKRVLQLLEPVVGRDNVRATVSAEVDFSQTESTSEEFKPNQGDAPATVRAIRNEESSLPGTPTPSGVPGAQSNQPQAQPAAPVNGAAQATRGAIGGAGGGAAGGNGRREAETRYEVDKKVSVTRNASGHCAASTPPWWSTTARASMPRARAAARRCRPKSSRSSRHWCSKALASTRNAATRCASSTRPSTPRRWPSPSRCRCGKSPACKTSSAAAPRLPRWPSWRWCWCSASSALPSSLSSSRHAVKGAAAS